jgi:hypothetical protein
VRTQVAPPFPTINRTPVTHAGAREIALAAKATRDSDAAGFVMLNVCGYIFKRT